jgi:CheY-like chemotaxis protein
MGNASNCRRILIVDDNPESAKSLAMLLRLRGFETRTAADGVEAVEAAEEFRPDVALLDLGLPKADGYEACRRIRRQSWGKAMRLLALTGRDRDEDRQRSTEAGFNGHLVKPIDLADLEPMLA